MQKLSRPFHCQFQDSLHEKTFIERCTHGLYDFTTGHVLVGTSLDMGLVFKTTNFLHMLVYCMKCVE